MSETGETTASLNQRLDEMAWPKVLGLLRAGAVLFRPSGMRDYYTWPAHPGAGYVYAECLTASGVKRRATDGVLISSGVDRYSLNPEWVEPEPAPPAPAPAVPDEQPDLFGAAA